MKTNILRLLLVAFTFGAVATMAIAADSGGEKKDGQSQGMMGGCCGG